MAVNSFRASVEATAIVQLERSPDRPAGQPEDPTPPGKRTPKERELANPEQFKAGMVGGLESAQAAMANPREHLNQEEMRRKIEAGALGPAVAKQPTLQDITQRLRALMEEARRSEDYSEGLLARLTGSDAMNPKPLEGDGPSNGFISDTLELITLLESTLERSNANMRRLQDAVMPHEVKAAE